MSRGDRSHAVRSNESAGSRESRSNNQSYSKTQKHASAQYGVRARFVPRKMTLFLPKIEVISRCIVLSPPQFLLIQFQWTAGINDAWGAKRGSNNRAPIPASAASGAATRNVLSFVFRPTITVDESGKDQPCFLSCSVKPA
jgi:hypothetical protein